MLRKIFIAALLVGAAGAASALVVTRPDRIDPARFAGVGGDPTRGETVYWASGCASCHAAEGDETRTVLAGGYRLATEFGTFVSPNISPDPVHGIGDWTLPQFADAMLNGTAPEGAHYYPAFPYGSYARMTDQDVADLWAFMGTLPASDVPSQPHDLTFPFNVRVAVGGWKLLNLDDDWVGPAGTEELERGRYLVEALGHCAECHTPRDATGGLERDRWMAGAPNPSGKGNIPGLTPAQLKWSAEDIAYYLETGFTPDFDSAGGSMASVVANLAKLPAEDRSAIAAYIKALPEAK